MLRKKKKVNVGECLSGNGKELIRRQKEVQICDNLKIKDIGIYQEMLLKVMYK